MANFIALIDPDPDRRRRFASAVAGHLAPIRGLTPGACDAGPLMIRWAAAPSAPVSWHSDGGRAAALWGQAVDAAGDSLNATTLASRWCDRRSEPPFAPDGFHAAIVSERGGETIVAADLLGFFPVYYAHRGSVLLVGSSPELFRHHPLFPIDVEPAGLVTVLLATAPLDGRTLTRGIRRLRQSHALVFREREGRCEEIRQFALSEPTTDAGASFDEYVEELDVAVREVIRRQVRHDIEHVLLLSGGRDSRLLGAYLHEERHDVAALTMADRRDYETRCARAVARTLGMRWYQSGVEMMSFAQTARRRARWEHLVGGFNIASISFATEPLRRLGQRVVTGLLLDGILAGRPAWPHPASFEKLLAGLTGRNLPHGLLASLLKPELSGLVPETIERMRALHEDASAVPALRTWRYQLAHSDPFSVGSYAWRLSFGAWPVVPVLAREFLRTCTSLPPVVLSNRRAEDALLRRFPAIARIPHIEQNAGIAPPLAPSAAYRVRASLRTGAGLLPRAVRHQVDPRHHLVYRMYDLNSPGWLGVRQDAEQGRHLLSSLFRMDALAAYLPGPEAFIPAGDRFTETRGRKMMLGLMLWADEHLP